MTILERLNSGDQKYLKLYKLDDKWVFASRKSDPLVSGNYKPDAVVIVARDRWGRLLVVKEHRPVVGEYIWGLPAGLIDISEDVTTAAAREVFEETGLTLMFRPGIDQVYTKTYSSPGMTDENVAIVTGLVIGEISDKYQEENEDITAYLMSADDMARAGFDKSETPMSMWLAFLLLGA